MKLDLNNPPKFYLLLVTLMGVFALMLTGQVDTENPQAWALIGSIVGYGVGNGIAAKNGQAVEPVFKSRRSDEGRIRLDVVMGWSILVVGVVTSALCAAVLLAGL
jgi:hypothetical protein